MKKAITILALSLTLSNWGKLQASSIEQAQPIDLTYAASRAVNSVVYIKVVINSKTQMMNYQDPFSDFFGDFFGQREQPQKREYKTPKRYAAGSGVILSSDGYIVTNNHVVQDADQITVKLNDNREYKARIIGTDKNTDLALLKIQAKNLSPIQIGNSNNLKIGEWVLAIGNPFSLTSTVTAGIVSAKARTIGGKPGSIESFIQTDAAINPGNSGGALVNTEGELVGINAMIYSQTGSYSGYGFAIPVDIMKKVVSDLKQYGTVQRAILGISGQDVSNYIDLQDMKGKKVDLGTDEGVYVGDVSTEGAAERSGIQKGDVITQIDGQQIKKFGQLQEILVNHKPGDKIKVIYLRNKKQHKVTIQLRNVQGTTKQLQKIDDLSLGVALRPLTNDEKQQLDLDHGLVIVAIRDGKMKDAGITKGIILTKINNTDMNTIDDFYNTVKATNMSTDRVLWIRAKTQTGLNKSFTVELDDPKQLNKKK